MSYFEECLTLGDWLSQDNRRALYKYLLVANLDSYTNQANTLLNKGVLAKTIANGEIIYRVKGRSVSYSARQLDSHEITSDIRDVKLTRLRFCNVRKLRKFFAQSDVDVIHNFPLPSANPQSEGGFGIDAYPYYDLAYYSNGKNRLLGFMKKLKTNDKELLTKLRTL